MRAFFMMKECARTFKVCEECKVVFNYTDHKTNHEDECCISIAKILDKTTNILALQDVYYKILRYFTSKDWIEPGTDNSIRVLPYCNRTSCNASKKDSKVYRIRTKKYLKLERKVSEQEHTIEWLLEENKKLKQENYALE